MKHVMNVVRSQVEQMVACKEESEHEQLKIIKASLTKLIRRRCDSKPIVFVSEKAEKRLRIDYRNGSFSSASESFENDEEEVVVRCNKYLDPEYKYKI